MKDWSWNQISGFEGEDRIISKVPIVLILQSYTGKIETKTIQLNKSGNVRLSDFVKSLNSVFRGHNGDQSLTGMEQLSRSKDISILRLYFEN